MTLFGVPTAGGQRVQAQLLHELHQDLLESGAEEGASAEEGRRHEDVCVEGAVQGGAGGNTGRFSVSFSVSINGGSVKDLTWSPGSD